MPYSHDAPAVFQLEFTTTVYGLKVRVHGANTGLAGTIAYWRQIAEQVRLLQPAGVLVIDDMDGDPPPPEQLGDFVSAVRGLGMEGVRIAFVEKHPDQLPRTELAGILAAEQGFRGHIFDNERAAITWLKYGEP